MADMKPRQAAHEIASVKAKALDAASAILASQGVEELNLRAIAESAGIGISSMYHYFAGKEDLLLSLALRGFEDLRADIDRNRRTGGFPNPMAAGARAYFGFAETRPALFSVMFSERLLTRHEDLREAEHQTLLAFQATVEADPRFPVDRKADVAVALWALGRGIAAITSSHPGGKLPEDLAAKLQGGLFYLLNRPD
jgi:AcrR family transcriptional regulator